MKPLDFSSNKPLEPGVYFVLQKTNEMSVVKMALVKENQGKLEVEIDGMNHGLDEVIGYDWSQKVK